MSNKPKTEDQLDQLYDGDFNDRFKIRGLSYYVDLVLHRYLSKDYADKTGKTLLYMCAQKGCLELALKLIQFGVDVDKAKPSGETPINQSS